MTTVHDLQWVSMETTYCLRQATVSHSNRLNEEAPPTDEADLSTLYCGGTREKARYGAPGPPVRGVFLWSLTSDCKQQTTGRRWANVLSAYAAILRCVVRSDQCDVFKIKQKWAQQRTVHYRAQWLMDCWVWCRYWNQQINRPNNVDAPIYLCYERNGLKCIKGGPKINLFFSQGPINLVFQPHPFISGWRWFEKLL